MRIAFTGGGTGGHVLPNIAIIDELNRGASKTEVFYVGGKHSIEERMISGKEIPFFGIHTGKLRRYFSLKNFTDFFRVPLGFFEALLILKRQKPDLVFAKGGYVSVPVMLAARLLGIPVWLHESDVSLGLSNKICSRFAEKIWLSFEETKRFLKGRNVEVVGNPIRREILNGDADKGKKLTGFSDVKPVVLIMGGSIGAQSLNQIVFDALPELLKHVQIVHITGSLAPNSEIAKLACKFEKHSGYKHFDFLEEELAHVYAITNLVVSRAGSGAIFEILAAQKPMILVPLPKSISRGDQIENALIFEQKGFAVSLDQTTLSPKRFAEFVLNLLQNSHPRECMVENQKKALLKNAAGKIGKAMVDL